MATTVVSWNIGKRREPWRQLAAMGADIAPLQEAEPACQYRRRARHGPRRALGLARLELALVRAPVRAAS